MATTLELWETYQKTQSNEDLLRWLKHRAWVLIMAENYDKSYLAEKALAVKKGAEEILDALEKPNEKWVRSYYVDGILRIEDGLAAIHMKTREIMKQCGETEEDYMLRGMGEVVRGK